MLAVRWHGRGDVRVDDVPRPGPPEGGRVQVRVAWCGLCGTDVEEVQKGPISIPVDVPHPLTGSVAPITLGHEFAGTVEDVGRGVGSLRRGDRVAVDTLIYCGTCHWCRRNQVVRCDQLGAVGLHADGGLAQLCNVPAKMCLPVPDQVSGEAAALAEPLAVAVRSLARGRLRAGEHVAVIGAGTVGLMVLQAALAMGAGQVHVVEPAADRRELAQELGATSVDTDPLGLGVDVAVEAAGNPAAVQGALRSLRKGGRAVLLGVDRRSVEIEPLRLVFDEKELIGSLSHVYDEEFRTAVDLLARHAVRVEPLVSDRIPIAAAVEKGLAALANEPQHHLKILVDPRAA